MQFNLRVSLMVKLPAATLLIDRCNKVTASRMLIKIEANWVTRLTELRSISRVMNNIIIIFYETDDSDGWWSTLQDFFISPVQHSTHNNSQHVQPDHFIMKLKFFFSYYGFMFISTFLRGSPRFLLSSRIIQRSAKTLNELHICCLPLSKRRSQNY